MEKRQGMFDSIADIDKTLAEEPHKEVISSATGDTLKKINEISDFIKQQASEIIELDNKNKSTIEKSKGLVTNQIKGVKQGQNLNNMYQPRVDSGYRQFDKSK